MSYLLLSNRLFLVFFVWFPLVIYNYEPIFTKKLLEPEYQPSRETHNQKQTTYYSLDGWRKDMLLQYLAVAH